MELRIDILLDRLRTQQERILRAIDADPLLVKREIAGLVLANATKQLFTPQEEHQLYAKGIVYRRDSLELVSLPLIKIYNLGEKEFQRGDLSNLAADSGARIRFLRKLDGSMIQRFQHGGKVWFSTRGILEGIALTQGMDDGEEIERPKQFDYVGAARSIAGERHPVLLDAERFDFEGRTLVFELIHPEARIITDYGPRRALILLAVFDRQEMRYWRYDEVQEFARKHGFEVVDAFSPAGNGLAEQIDDLLRSIEGTDQEGTVLTLENAREVVYRVKIKSADYLRLFRLMVRCSYKATAEMLDAFAEVPSWEAFEQHLQSLGSESVPEEFLGAYREYHGQYVQMVAESERIAMEVKQKTAGILAELTDVADPRERRKRFAMRVALEKRKALFFHALDGRLDWRKVAES